MSIDTAEKRRSISGIGFMPLIPGVTPNVLKDAEWRQQVGWSYSGIVVTGTEPPVISDYTMRGHIDIEISLEIS